MKDKLKVAVIYSLSNIISASIAVVCFDIYRSLTTSYIFQGLDSPFMFIFKGSLLSPICIPGLICAIVFKPYRNETILSGIIGGVATIYFADKFLQFDSDYPKFLILTPLVSAISVFFIDKIGRAFRDEILIKNKSNE